MNRGSLLGKGLFISVVGAFMVAAFEPDTGGHFGPATIGVLLMFGGLAAAAVGIGRLFR